jgi:histidinol-phosphate phosphatase family protein
VLVPFAASWWAVFGRLRARRIAPRARADRWRPERPRAVLFDRDGTLIHDVAYNDDPERVRPVDGARATLERLRAAGVATAIITNQSGIGRGMIDRSRVDDVNTRVDELLGPFGTIQLCDHAPDVGCPCRKPAPGMIFDAAARLGVEPSQCAVVGDIGADMQAAAAAGVRAILVPTPATLPEEVAAAPELANTIGDAVELLLQGRLVDHADPESAKVRVIGP